MFAQRLWGGKRLLWSSLFFRADGLPCWIYRRMYHKSLLRWPFLIKCESKGRELFWVQTIRLLWLRKSFKASVKYGYYSKALMSQQTVKKTLSYGCGQNITYSLPYTWLQSLTSTAHCVFTELYVALFWLNGHCECVTMKVKLSLHFKLLLCALPVLAQNLIVTSCTYSFFSWEPAPVSELN